MTSPKRSELLSSTERYHLGHVAHIPDIGEGALVVIPTYNESENLHSLIAEIRRAAPKADVLIVDDNSPDGTGALAEELAKTDPCIHVLHRSSKQGLGTAYVTAFKWVCGRDYTRVVQMDADLSHDPSYLPHLLESLREFDLAIGSRYAYGISVVNWSLWRLAISIVGCCYARLLTRVPVKDMTSGFKAFRRDFLLRVPLDRIHSNGYAFQIEMNFWVDRLGGKICEVPIIFVDRRVGVSKMDGGVIVEALFTPCRLWWTWFTRR